MLSVLLAQAKPQIVFPTRRHDAWADIYGRKGEQGYDKLVLGRGELSGVGDLRSRRLPQNRAEFRLWDLFGNSYTEGWIFRQAGVQWRATRLLPALPWYRARRYRVDVLRPKAGWKAFWRRLDDLGAWTLPDGNDVVRKSHTRDVTLDGVVYFVETQRGGVYRAYGYANPMPEDSPQAARLLGIEHYIGSQFRRDPAWPKAEQKRAEEQAKAHARSRDKGSGRIELPSGLTTPSSAGPQG